MKTVWALSAGVAILGVAVSAALNFNSPSQATGPALSQDMLRALKQPPQNSIRLQAVTIPQGVAYYAIIPKQYRVIPAVSDRLQRLETFAADAATEPAVVINAGYFDPENHKTISYITVDGKQVADPTQNERLTGNPNLKPYLPQVFNRSELRVYRCKEGQRYDITVHNAAVPGGCELKHALGAGPQLLPADRSIEEAVTAVDKTGKLIRDPFGVRYPNARSAVGITQSGSVILLMVGQSPERKAYGVTFEQVRSLLGSLGAVKALSLDGGSSSAIIMRDLLPEQPSGDKTASDKPTVIYGKFNKEGQAVKRPVKSVLMVLPPEA